MKNIKLILFLIVVLNCSVYSQVQVLQNSNTSVHIKWSGSEAMVFNGVPANSNAWGEDLVYELTSSTTDNRTMGALGGIPLIHVWNELFSYSIYNQSTYLEPVSIVTTYDGNYYEVIVTGGTKLVLQTTEGDYFEGIRAYAELMEEEGIAVQEAPEWAFDPIWETYGYEENFNKNTIIELIPILKRLGIKTITIDSGWYGSGLGEDISFGTGDFIVNEDVVGTEEEFTEFIDYLHGEGFKVRVWWVPGVGEMETQLYEQHPDWFTDNVVASTDDTGDIYLDPTNPEVIAWNQAVIERFLSYGVDGFKQDDIYNYVNIAPEYQQAYADLINGNLNLCIDNKPDFVINSCNCGISQNIYQMNGQNQLIVSDPVGSTQYRMRAKYLKALNIDDKAAILGDHIELTEGDVGPEDMADPEFYTWMDFASVVPLGLVLETKFREEPGPLYDAWFDLYSYYKFYEMEWINIPYYGEEIESYLLQDDSGNKFYSFYTHVKDQDFTGEITFQYLEPNQQYYVFDYVNNEVLDSFFTNTSTYTTNAAFSNALNLVLSTSPNSTFYALKNVETKVTVFPNPANDFVNVHVSENLEGGELRVFNAQGQLVKYFEKVNTENTISLDGLPSGFYYFNVVSYYLSDSAVIVIE